MTQSGSQDWGFIDASVQDAIHAHIANHDIYFEDFLSQDDQIKEPLSPELQKISDILDDTIRPSLQMDGGDVELVELEGDILTLKYMGACGGCPSSMTYTLDAMQQILRQKYNDTLQIAVVD